MAAMMAENRGAGKMCPSSAISASPEPMPISAVAIGRPIASSEPNAISSTIAAAPTPIPLEAPPYGVSARSTTSPPRLNVTPSLLAAVASCISAVASLLGMCAPGDVELDGGVGDVPVRGQVPRCRVRIGHPGDVRRSVGVKGVTRP